MESFRPKRNLQTGHIGFSLSQNRGVWLPTPLESIEFIEEDHIIRVLRHTGWHKSDAAKILGITRQTLDNKIEKYSIKK